MISAIHPRRTVPRRKAAIPVSDFGVQFPFVALPLLLGLLAGCFVGLFSFLSVDAAALLDPLLSDGTNPGFFRSLWQTIRFPLFALLCATSLLGVFLIPALSLLRGFLLGCSVAAVFHAEAFRGLLFAAVSIGIPMLFEIPLFLLASLDGLRLSQALFSLMRGGERVPLAQGSVGGRCLLFLLLTALEVLYFCSLLPLLARLF